MNILERMRAKLDECRVAGVQPKAFMLGTRTSIRVTRCLMAWRCGGHEMRSRTTLVALFEGVI